MNRFVVVSAVVAAALGAPPAVAAASVLVSGSNPFATCSTAHQTGTNHLNAEVEPSVT